MVTKAMDKNVEMYTGTMQEKYKKYQLHYVCVCWYLVKKTIVVRLSCQVYNPR